MSYKEKNLTADFSKWLRKDPKATMLQFLFAVEFKLKHGKESLHLIRDFQPQQISSLLKATNGCVYHKISDMGMGLKPFDSLQICYAPAFVAICWYEPRKRKTLYFIDVRDIKKRLDREYFKYIEADARAEAIYTIELM